MITTSAAQIIVALLPLASAWRLTPLTIDQHPCKPEKLKAQNRYICDSNGDVKCLTGWKDKDYNKDPHFPCSEPICEPKCLNGDCKLPNVCVCEIGWDGLDCGTCIDMPGCVNGGCIKTDEEGVEKGEPLTCNCKENWQGALCDVPKCPADENDPNSKPDCNNNGICVDTAGEAHECKCNLGWGGSTCQDCEPLMGCKEKNTVDVDNDGKGDGCKVNSGSGAGGSGAGGSGAGGSGAGGNNNGDTSSIQQEPNSCQCTKHWSGIFCEEPRCLAADGEEEITCVHGKCKYVENVEAAFCHCDVGWQGEKCDQCVPQDGCPDSDSQSRDIIKIAACVQPNECRCQGAPSDINEDTKKCTSWIAEGKCGSKEDCDPGKVCNVEAEKPLEGSCVDCVNDTDCDGDKKCNTDMSLCVVCIDNMDCDDGFFCAGDGNCARNSKRFW